MTKSFCDVCGVELDKRNLPSGGFLVKSRLGACLNTADGRVFHFEVIGAVGKCANDGEFCKYCILDALNRTDDRPRYGETQTKELP